MFDFEAVEKAFLEESRARTTFQQEGSRYGNLFLGSDIESTLKYALCAIREDTDKVGAIFFDDWTVFEEFISDNKNFKSANFKEFKALTKGKWQYPDFYHLDKEHGTIVYAET